MKLPDAEYQQVAKFAETLERVIAENFVSCILYGSAVRGNYAPGRSDVNVLIALRTSTFELHRQIAEPFQALKAKLNVSPMVLGMDVAQRTFECFALKFLSIKRSHVVLRGSAIFEQFNVDKKQLDFLAEQELRNLRLRMVYGYLQNSKSTDALSQLVFRNHSKAVVILSDILRIENADVPTTFAERYDGMERFFGVPVAVLREVQALKDNAKYPSLANLNELYGALFGLVDRVLHLVQSKGMLA